jgi:hypothetical protein
LQALTFQVWMLERENARLRAANATLTAQLDRGAHTHPNPLGEAVRTSPDGPLGGAGDGADVAADAG